MWTLKVDQVGLGDGSSYRSDLDPRAYDLLGPCKSVKFKTKIKNLRFVTDIWEKKLKFEIWLIDLNVFIEWFEIWQSDLISDLPITGLKSHLLTITRISAITTGE